MNDMLVALFLGALIGFKISELLHESKKQKEEYLRECYRLSSLENYSDDDFVNLVK